MHTWRCTVITLMRDRFSFEIRASSLRSVYAALDVAYPARRAELIINTTRRTAA